MDRPLDPRAVGESPFDSVDDQIAASELARRATRSGVGASTLVHLQDAFDALAIDYQNTPPLRLSSRIRGYLRYLTQLLDGHATLAERARLTTLGGWFALLAATVDIDLRRYGVAAARLRAAATLAEEVGDVEVRAWCFETAAWRALTDGSYREAVELSRAARGLAPPRSSIAVQAAAQEGRALARLGDRKGTYAAVDRVHALVSTLPRTSRPEHHFRYDPDKSTAYIATTLAWVGDPAAEGFARQVIARLAPHGERWPRRVATARLDLSLALVAANQLEEASATAQAAVLSGRIVPSNRWRATEILTRLEEKAGAPATNLRAALDTLRG